MARRGKPDPNQPPPGQYPQGPQGQYAPGPQDPNQQGQYQQGPYPGQNQYAPQQPKKKPIYKRVWFWLLAIILVIIIATALNGGGDSAPSDSPNQASDSAAQGSEEAAEEPAAEPIAVTAGTLIEDMDSNPLKAEQTYKDQYVEVTGFVSNVDAQGDYFSVNDGPDSISFTSIRADIEDDQVPQVAEFSNGEEVTFTGTVTDVGEVMGYSIDVDSIQ